MRRWYWVVGIVIWTAACADEGREAREAAGEAMTQPVNEARGQASQPAPATQPASATQSTSAMQTASSTQPAQAAHPAGEYAGLHNVFVVAEGILSGSVPEGDAGFDALRGLGVRTIISVDGMTPDVQRAHEHGMRYVHLPVGYDGIPDEKQNRLARAVRDLPRPIYIHCHHGQHRGPAAAASAAVVLGLLSPAEGVAYLKQAGTGDMYGGLYRCVREAVPAGAAELDAVSNDFPEIAQISGIVAAMVEIDAAFEHLRLIQKAGWRVPEDHPDLVPAVEADRLGTLLESMDRADAANVSRAGRETFDTLAGEGAHAARELSRLLKDREAAGDALDRGVERVRTSCQQCHRQFRDRETGG